MRARHVDSAQSVLEFCTNVSVPNIEYYRKTQASAPPPSYRTVCLSVWKVEVLVRWEWVDEQRHTHGIPGPFLGKDSIRVVACMGMVPTGAYV